MHRTCGCGTAPPLSDVIGDPGLARLVRLAVSAVGGYVDARQALGRARRADLLLGEGAGLRDYHLAQSAGESCLGQFRQVEAGLHEVIDGLDQARREALGVSFAGQAPGQAAGARTRGALALIDSGASPDAARVAMEQLGAELDRVGGLTTADQGLAYLDERLGRMVDEREPLRAVDDPELGFCVLILILTSIFALLVVFAVIICALAGCDPGALLDEMIRNACTGRG